MTLHIIIILVISLYNNVVYDGNDDGDDGDGDDADADDPQERRGEWSIEFLADDLPQREVEGKQVIIIFIIIIINLTTLMMIMPTIMMIMPTIMVIIMIL